MEKTTIGTRIREKLLAVNGGNKSALARHLGISPQAVTQWIKDETEPRRKYLTKLAAFLNTTPEYLFYGSDPALKSPNIEPIQSKGKVPLVRWTQIGGEEGVNYEDTEEFLSCPITHSNETFALRVSGESMYNATESTFFKDGDIIFVDPKRQPVNGSFVVIRFKDEGEAALKKIIFEGEKTYLKALNPAWPNQIIRMMPDTVLCGVVILKCEIV